MALLVVLNRLDVRPLEVQTALDQEGLGGIVGREASGEGLRDPPGLAEVGGSGDVGDDVGLHGGVKRFRQPANRVG